MKMAMPCSLVSGLEIHIHHPSGCPHRCANNHPFSVPGFRQIPPSPCFPAKGCRTPVLSQVLLYFKAPHFRGPHCRPTLILWGRVSLHCGWFWLVLENSCVPAQRFRIYGKSQCTTGTRICLPQPASLFQW